MIVGHVNWVGAKVVPTIGTLGWGATPARGKSAFCQSHGSPVCTQCPGGGPSIFALGKGVRGLKGERGLKSSLILL